MMRKFIKRWGIYLAWISALLASYFTFYYTEVLNCSCPLLWYQRTMLFPLVIILGMGAYKNDAKIIFYLWPLIVIGAIFAFLQMSDQWVYRQIYEFLGCAKCEIKPLLYGFIDLSFINFVLFGLMFLFLFFSDKKSSIKIAKQRQKRK